MIIILETILFFLRYSKTLLGINTVIHIFCLNIMCIFIIRYVSDFVKMKSRTMLHSSSLR